MQKICTILSFILIATYNCAQTDSSVYQLYKDRWVVHTSLSINDAPFSFKGDLVNNKLDFRSNQNLTHGIGIAHKWFALTLNYKIPGYLRSTEKYGKTKYINLGLKFNLKHWFFSINAYLYRGYGIKNLSSVTDTNILTSAGYYLNNGLASFSTDLNAYYFFAKNMNMKPAMGIVGRYTNSVHGMYLRMTISYQILSDSNRLIPKSLVYSNKSLYSSSSISALGTGVIPGYAYINNLDGWQFGVFAGIGAVIQAKSYSYHSITRSFLGLSPRFDLRLQGGYNVNNWFLMLTSAFNQRHIDFNNFKYNQYYYYVKLTYGYRFR